MPYNAQPASVRLTVLQVGGHSSLRLRPGIGGRANVLAVHTEALAGRGETCRWMSAAAGASGDRVLASNNQTAH